MNEELIKSFLWSYVAHAVLILSFCMFLNRLWEFILGFKRYLEFYEIKRIFKEYSLFQMPFIQWSELALAACFLVLYILFLTFETVDHGLVATIMSVWFFIAFQIAVKMRESLSRRYQIFKPCNKATAWMCINIVILVLLLGQIITEKIEDPILGVIFFILPLVFSCLFFFVYGLFIVLCQCIYRKIYLKRHVFEAQEKLASEKKEIAFWTDAEIDAVEKEYKDSLIRVPNSLCAFHYCNKLWCGDCRYKNAKEFSSSVINGCDYLRATLRSIEEEKCKRKK